MNLKTGKIGEKLFERALICDYEQLFSFIGLEVITS